MKRGNRPPNPKIKPRPGANPAPKTPKLTPAQEEKIRSADMLYLRAEILVKGVAAELARDYNGVDTLYCCASLLSDACAMKKQAYKMNDEATRDNDAAFVRDARRRRR